MKTTDPGYPIYKDAITRALQSLGYEDRTAASIVEAYEPVIEALGGYPTPDDYAQQLHRAWANGTPCAAWLAFIEANRRPAARSRKKKPNVQINVNAQVARLPKRRATLVK
jgi:hypothetical protein